jgi:hypothetical protein
LGAKEPPLMGKAICEVPFSGAALSMSAMS